MDSEVELDHFLKIKTNGRDDSQSNFINYPYEATPYCVLQALANSGYITKRDTIIDFGCGKGRVDFFLAYATKAKMIGVEFDERLYNSAIANKEKAISANRTTFIKSCASTYYIQILLQAHTSSIRLIRKFYLRLLKTLKQASNETNARLKCSSIILLVNISNY